MSCYHKLSVREHVSITSYLSENILRLFRSAYGAGELEAHDPREQRRLNFRRADLGDKCVHHRHFDVARRRYCDGINPIQQVVVDANRNVPSLRKRSANHNHTDTNTLC